MSSEQAPTFFISDLHLDESRTQVTEAFRQFLSKTAKGARAIYILGDFVDAWIGDDDSSRFIRRLKSDIAQCVSSGTSVYFIHGNRDFLIGRRFADDTGIKMLDEHSVITLYGEKVLLLHGDTLCSDDEAYQRFRAKVRNPAWQKKVLKLPLFIRRLMAARMRAKSRRANANKAEEILDVSDNTVLDTFTKYRVKKMIHGHTHRPKRHLIEHNGKTLERIVLGDWEDYGWYLRADTNGLSLEKFVINDHISASQKS